MPEWITNIIFGTVIVFIGIPVGLVVLASLSHLLTRVIAKAVITSIKEVKKEEEQKHGKGTIGKRKA